MGQVASLRSPLLPEFGSSSFWLSDLKFSQRLIAKFTKLQTEFGFAIQFDTFVKIFSNEKSSSSSSIKPDEFRRVFSIWDFSGSGKIDSLQIFAGSLLCCKATFAQKVISLFQLFDLDMNKTISRDEMTILIRASLNGFCRMTGVEPPTLAELAEVAKIAFKSADRQEHKDNKIEQNELLAWALCTPECVNILTRFNTIDANEVRKQLKVALIEEREFIRPPKPPIPTIQSTQAELSNKQRANSNNSNNSSTTNNNNTNPNNDEKENKTGSNSTELPLSGKEKSRIAKRVEEARFLKKIFDQLDTKGEQSVSINEFNFALKKNEVELSKLTAALQRRSSTAGSSAVPMRSFELSFTAGPNKSNLSLGFRDLLKAWYGNNENLIGKRELDYLLSLLVIKAIPETIVKKIKGIFDELDRDFTGKVSFSNIMQVLAPSNKLAEYIQVAPILEKYRIDLNANSASTLPEGKSKLATVGEQSTTITTGGNRGSVSAVSTGGRNSVVGNPSKRSSLSSNQASAASAAPAVPADELITLPDLLLRLFESTHKNQIPEILVWGKPSRILTAEQKKDLILLFDLYDADHSGFIDFEELKTSALQFNANMEENELIHLLNVMDLNSDQRVDKFEFMRFYRHIWDSNVNFKLGKPVGKSNKLL